MSYKITLSTRDKQQFEFTCTAEQTVQEAAEAASLYPPFSCKSGICGACLATCKTGKYSLASYSDEVLSAEAVAQGDILLCRTIPKTDLHISVPYTADNIPQHIHKPRTAQIIALDNIAERTVKLVLQLEADSELGLAFDFEPGQFVELEVPGTKLMRAYSLANTPNWDGRLEFLIRLQEQGQFSAFLQQAVIGQSLLVHAPSGAFVLNKQSANPRCFIAGGTGLSPFLAMLQRAAEWGEDHPTQLFLGVNTEAEIMCQAELAALQQSLSHLAVQICVWKPVTDWSGFIGTPVDALRNYLQQHNSTQDIYLCGPPRLVAGASEIALDAGIDKARIYSERFVAS